MDVEPVLRVLQSLGEPVALIGATVLVLAKWKWEADIIDRSESMSIGGLDIGVPRTSDLILLKLAAGGYGDLQDAAALLAMGDPAAVVREVETHIDAVRPDVRLLWRELLAATER